MLTVPRADRASCRSPGSIEGKRRKKEGEEIALTRHCEEPGATKQSNKGDCFVPSGLAMTVL
jgi:hypothetical protein